MHFMRQRKDTRLLCLDGDNEGDPATSYPEEAWDAEHPVDNPYTHEPYTHGSKNCVRASISMIAWKYGGSLSQDRLSYQLFENWGSPIEDIGWTQ